MNITDDVYKEKYIKYKNKYLNLKNNVDEDNEGGGLFSSMSFANTISAKLLQRLDSDTSFKNKKLDDDGYSIAFNNISIISTNSISYNVSLGDKQKKYTFYINDSEKYKDMKPPNGFVLKITDDYNKDTQFNLDNNWDGNIQASSTTFFEALMNILKPLYTKDTYFSISDKDIPTFLTNIVNHIKKNPYPNYILTNAANKINFKYTNESIDKTFVITFNYKDSAIHIVNEGKDINNSYKFNRNYSSNYNDVKDKLIQPILEYIKVNIDFYEQIHNLDIPTNIKNKYPIVETIIKNNELIFTIKQKQKINCTIIDKDKITFGKNSVEINGLDNLIEKIKTNLEGVVKYYTLLDEVNTKISEIKNKTNSIKIINNDTDLSIKNGDQPIKNIEDFNIIIEKLLNLSSSQQT